MVGQQPEPTDHTQLHAKTTIRIYVMTLKHMCARYHPNPYRRIHRDERWILVQVYSGNIRANFTWMFVWTTPMNSPTRSSRRRSRENTVFGVAMWIEDTMHIVALTRVVWRNVVDQWPTPPQRRYMTLCAFICYDTVRFLFVCVPAHKQQVVLHLWSILTMSRRWFYANIYS